ncbi:MAG: helix-hairpin-helix domain-containing protein [Candidatus Glassbacteria bacterium]|nr:helix-hairpin-helix domain-containing protein [Candidatus Glassbacteria bacterium]
MSFLTGKQKLAAALLCALALVGAGVRLFLAERRGAGGQAAGGAAADSAVVAALTAELAEQTGPVRINAADARTLERLPGIGPLLAARIVAERGRGGPFSGPEQLAARVSGIGASTVAQWEGRATYSDSTSGEGK